MGAGLSPVLEIGASRAMDDLFDALTEGGGIPDTLHMKNTGDRRAQHYAAGGKGRGHRRTLLASGAVFLDQNGTMR